jgi:hypothetical protein
MIMETTVPTVGHNRVKPSVYFNPMAQPISNSPAVIRIAQVIGVASFQTIAKHCSKSYSNSAVSSSRFFSLRRSGRIVGNPSFTGRLSTIGGNGQLLRKDRHNPYLEAHLWIAKRSNS